MSAPWEDYQSEESGPWAEYAQEAAPEMGAAEAAARGFGQIGGFGFSDEILGANLTVRDYLSGKFGAKEIPEQYRRLRDEQRAQDEQAWQERPGAYGTGGAAGFGASLLLPGGAAARGISGAAKVGGAMGAAGALGMSEADLMEGDVAGAAKDTAIGGTVGALGGAGVAKGLEKLAPRLSSMAQGLKRWAQEARYKGLSPSTKHGVDLGPDRARDIGQYMFDKDIGSGYASQEDMWRATKDLMASENGPGAALGHLRAKGDLLGSAPTPAQLQARIQSEVAGPSQTGLRREQSELLKMAREEVDNLNLLDTLAPSEELQGFMSYADDAIDPSVVRVSRANPDYQPAPQGGPQPTALNEPVGQQVPTPTPDPLTHTPKAPQQMDAFPMPIEEQMPLLPVDLANEVRAPAPSRSPVFPREGLAPDVPQPSQSLIDAPAVSNPSYRPVPKTLEREVALPRSNYEEFRAAQELSGDIPTYDLSKGSSFSENANLATRLNNFVDTEGIRRPVSVVSDVADIVARENDAALRQVLPPEDVARYDPLKKEWGMLEDMQKILRRSTGRELSAGGNVPLSRFGLFQQAFNVVLPPGVRGSAYMKTSQILQSQPGRLGKYAPQLQAAAARGAQALGSSMFMLQQRDPEFQQLMHQLSEAE